MKSASRHPSPLVWAPLILVLLAMALRWLKLESEGNTLLPNFSPWMALAFTGTLLFSRQGVLPWWSWPLMLLGVDFAAMGAGFVSMLVEYPSTGMTYLLYAVAAFTADKMRGDSGIMKTLLGVTACSLLFYIITNTISWWSMPEYSKSLQGWLQALTSGLPGYPPTWTFFRNALLSDLAFSALLLTAFNVEARSRALPPLRWAATA